MRIIASDETASHVILNPSLTGTERVLFELREYYDVHMGPGVDPPQAFFDRTKFLSNLSAIINADILLEGPIGTFRSEVVKWGGDSALKELKGHITTNDYTDLIYMVSNEAVPGIYVVSASVSGASNVSNLRRLDKIVLDSLFVEVVTDFFIIQSSDPVSE